MRFAVLSLACGLTSALFLGSGCDSRNNARKPAPKNAPAPQELAIEPKADGLREIDGPELIAEIRASKRKATLLNVWASWCGSCKRELPMLVDLGQALAAEGVAVMFVSVDKPDARPAAVALLETLAPKPSSFIVRGSLGPFKRAVNPNWKGALPATALYDGDGELLWFWPGPVLEHEITPIITAHLAGAPLEGPTLVEPGPP
jgi:thiol-disulfide isomerase/thioredoxin